MSQRQKNKRDPRPTLFQHPSPTASHVELPVAGASAPTTAGGLQSSITKQQAPTSHQRSTSTAPTSSPMDPLRPSQTNPRRQLGGTGSSTLGGLIVPQLRTGESTRATDRTDALWSEMQATLEEVELSASGGTRVFGPDHDRKLAELRAAQINLAQAWARSEADEAVGANISSDAAAAAVPNAERLSGGVDAGKTDGTAAGTEGGARSTGTGSARPGSSGAGAERLGQKLEEETEVDILHARKRREANDRYFQRVNQGVLDVVAKLEDVAIAMRAVEQESKDVWGETESVPSSAKP